MQDSTHNKFYLTTTLPYVNSDPHIGFAMEFIRADVIARYKRLVGYDVFFNTGTDEHGAKIYENAVKQGMDVKMYVDGYAEKFKELKELLGISDVHFIRTTDSNHLAAAKKMWELCNANGYIYKKTYQTKYCVGCELSKTDSELENGKCPIHPSYEIQLLDEENYFFRFSKFSGRGHKDSLLDFYDENPDFVIPDFRYNEIKVFVERGLEDFSISRLKEKMPWGVPVPGDDEHVMYVWFDALTSYISTLGWGTSEVDFDFWEEGTPVQYCGKDNLRQQSAMWQAMLMAAGLPNSKHIIIDGFITSGGQKMSKSIGNVISPFDIIEAYKNVTDYPEEVLRFVLLHEISSFEDGDVTMESIKTAYTAHLQNGIGNLTNRIMKMAITNAVTAEQARLVTLNNFLDVFQTKEAISSLMMRVNALDKKIQEEEAFKIVKIDKIKGDAFISEYVSELEGIAKNLEIFLPKTSAKILECIYEFKMPEKPLFGRLP